MPKPLTGAELKKVGAGPFFLTDIADADDGKERLFLTTQKGKIYTYSTKTNTHDKVPFMDLSRKVVMRYDMGLLAIAFHPKFKANRKFYLFYSGKGKSSKGHGYVARVSEFLANPDLSKGLPKTERELLVYPSHVACRRGGALVFGPDNMLYIGVGDSAGKRMKGAASGMTAQMTDTVLGSILRIDVDKPGDETTPYAIPGDNPFAGQSKKRGEIHAFGFRNPWRISFDSKTQLLWVADNGEDTREEINIVTKGGNYGWPWREGLILFPGLTTDEKKKVPTTQFINPIWDYKNLPPRAKAYAIVGGHVYRGKAIPAIEGIYFFADHGVRTVMGIKYDQAQNKVTQAYTVATLKQAPTSFCRDREGEIWMVTYAPGVIYKLVEKK